MAPSLAQDTPQQHSICQRQWLDLDPGSPAVPCSQGRELALQCHPVCHRSLELDLLRVRNSSKLKTQPMRRPLARLGVIRVPWMAPCKPFQYDQFRYPPFGPRIISCPADHCYRPGAIGDHIHGALQGGGQWRRWYACVVSATFRESLVSSTVLKEGLFPVWDHGPNQPGVGYLSH